MQPRNRNWPRDAPRQGNRPCWLIVYFEGPVVVGFQSVSHTKRSAPRSQETSHPPTGTWSGSCIASAVGAFMAMTTKSAPTWTKK